jgi:DNA polymerase-4
MILFLFVPGFYASVEQADHPELRGRPVLVGGDPRKRGTVNSASPEAQARGVVEGVPTAEALDRCPEAEVRPTRLRRYREVGGALRAIAWSQTDRVEPDGLDGVYLEVPPGDSPVTLAAELCVRVRGELGLPAVAGVGTTRFVAHVAARHCNEGGIRVIEPEQTRAFLAELPVTEIWGLGPESARRLAEHGIERIGNLQERSLAELDGIVGRIASTFRPLALGEDDNRIRARPRPKSLSQEETLPEATADLATLSERVSELAARIAQVLERESRAARTLTVGLEFADAQQLTRTQTEARPVSRHAELRDAALALLARARSEGRLVRRLRLQVSNFARREPDGAPRQLDLFS